jgi:hypothetical protein
VVHPQGALGLTFFLPPAALAFAAAFIFPVEPVWRRGVIAVLSTMATVLLTLVYGVFASCALGNCI